MTDFTRQGRIGRRLQEMYRKVLDEDLPDEIIELLCKAGLRLELDRLEAERKQRLAAESAPDPLAPDYRRSRRRQTPIGRGLQQLYGSVLKEDVPQEFIELLCEYAVKREAREKEAGEDTERTPPE
ncbi:MAG TPA: NepR family anti-sigma factor [Hyphomonadaceae bacterium]|jgi:hypothetical protein|nr:NepR family anti-sigma factor [Hyphomonadaceae bacterium]